MRWAEVREVARGTLLYLPEAAARLTDGRIGAQDVVLTESPVLAVKPGRAENSEVLRLSKLDYAVSPPSSPNTSIASFASSFKIMSSPSPSLERRLDHLVHLSPHGTLPDTVGALAQLFTVLPGGTHADGLTCVARSLLLKT